MVKLTKYVVLKSVVHSTFDSGFRMLGYEVVEFIETDEKFDLPKDLIGRILNKKALDYAERAASRKKDGTAGKAEE